MPGCSHDRMAVSRRRYERWARTRLAALELAAALVALGLMAALLWWS